MEVFENILYWASLVVAVFGFFINIFGLCFLARLPNKTRFHRLLMVLVIADIFVLFVGMFTFILEALNDDLLGTLLVAQLITLIANPMLYLSIFVSITLALERYISIRHCFFFLRHPYLDSAYMLALPSIVLTCILMTINLRGIFTLIEFRDITQIVYNVINTIPFLTCTMTHIGRVGGILVTRSPWDLWGDNDDIYSNDSNEVEKGPTFFILTSIFVAIIPCILLIVLSILIKKTLKKSPIERNGAIGEEMRNVERKLARIGFVIAVVFIVCHILRAIMNIVDIFTLKFITKTEENCYNNSYDNTIFCYNNTWQEPEDTPGVRIVWSISDFAIVTNCSINFLIYFHYSGGGVKKKITSIFCMETSSWELAKKKHIALTLVIFIFMFITIFVAYSVNWDARVVITAVVIVVDAIALIVASAVMALFYCRKSAFCPSVLKNIAMSIAIFVAICIITITIITFLTIAMAAILIIIHYLQIMIIEKSIGPLFSLILYCKSSYRICGRFYRRGL